MPDLTSPSKQIAIIFYGGFKNRLGGVVMHANTLQKELINMGWEAKIFSLEALPVWARYLPHITEKLLNFFRKPLGFYYKGRVTRLLYKFFYQERADLYLFEDIYLAWNSLQPSITILHAVWSDNLQAYNLSVEKIDRLIRKESECIGNIKHPVATVSIPYKDYLVNKHFSKHRLRKNLDVIELGVELDEYPIRNLRTGSRSLIYCGALEARKNVGFLLEVFEAIFSSDPGSVLTIIGDGPERLMLEGRASDLGLPVRFLGRKPHDQVISELLRHNIYIHTSMKESFSFALLEAKLCGLTTCALATLEVPKEFIDLAVPRFDAQEWAELILGNVVNPDPHPLKAFNSIRMTERTLNLAKFGFPD